MIIKQNYSLKDHNSYELDSICKRAYFPENVADVQYLYSEPDLLDEAVVIGRGNNLILSNQYYNRDFIILSDNFAYNEVKGNTLFAHAGANMYELSQVAYNHSLSGLEYFVDIPGSLGGAIAMNAGSNGIEIKDILVKATYFDPTTKAVGQLTNSEIEFSYRDSFFQKNPHIIVLDAVLRLEVSEKQLLKETMEIVLERRRSKQPKEYPNAGSVFKRPEGRFVGPMIEELGLKGYTIGGAQVSTKHAGFIINIGGAKGSDILQLISHIQNEVFKEFNVILEVEQRII